MCLVLAWFWLPVLVRWHALDAFLLAVSLSCLFAAFVTSKSGSIGRKVAVVTTVVVVIEGLVVVARLILAGTLSAGWSGG